MKIATSVRLFLGRSVKHRRTVSDQEIHDFMVSDVTPTFPAFSLTDCRGYWEGEPEESTVIEIILGPEADLDVAKAAVSRIARSYCRQYRQDCVALFVGSGVFSLVSATEG